MSNSTNVVPFDFEGHDVRIVDQNGDAWFILKDVLAAMGSSTRPAIAKSSIEQGLGAGYTANTQLDTGFGLKDVTIINETAATFLVSRSNTETGKRLNKWIHGEVLPSIRKTGAYQVQPQLPNFNDPVEAARAWADVKEEAIRLEKLSEDQTKQIEEDRPKVEYYEKVGDSSGLMTITDAIKRMNLGFGRNKAFEKMRNIGILQSSRASWNQPYQTFIDRGYFVVKQKTLISGMIVPVTLVTSKGHQWLFEALK